MLGNIPIPIGSHVACCSSSGIKAMVMVRDPSLILALKSKPIDRPTHPRGPESCSMGLGFPCVACGMFYKHVSSRPSLPDRPLLGTIEELQIGD